MLDQATVSNAIAAWEQELGRDAVISGIEELAEYTRSVCASKREVVAVLKPLSSGQVQRVVAIANEFKVPLYPISTGKQWGLGSKLPVRDGAAIIDLSGMNRIIEVNAQFHYAVVEPGVTQRQLNDYIRENNLPLMLNVTGSTSDTSLIGNAMDRGVGYFESRAEGIANLTVVLGNGEVVKTGFGHYERAKTKNLYRHGAGPDITGLFPQGNFGIVTSACIDLIPAPDEHMAAIIKIDNGDKLPKLLEALVTLRARGIVSTVVHVGNRERSYITLAPLLYEQLLASGEPPNEATRNKAEKWLEEGGFGQWSAAIGILGTKAQLKIARREIRKATASFAKSMFLNDALIERVKSIALNLRFIPAVRKQLMMLNAIEPVYGLTRGDATDEALKGVYWAAGDFERLDEPDPDHSDSGLIFCVPTLPNDAGIICETLAATRNICSQLGFDAAITVNLINAKASEAVVSLAFKRNEKKQTDEARYCIGALEKYYMENGLPLLRYGIDSMPKYISEADSFWRTIRELKKSLDPNHIIAPGRYNLV